MAEWKKVIVSGSNAELNKLVVDTHISASLFSGSFVGNGSGLTGLTAAAITTYTNAADNRVITSVDSTTVNGEANLTFDGSTLNVAGTVDANIATIGSAGDFTIQDDGGTGATLLTKGAGRAVRIGDTAAAGNSVEVTVDDSANEVKLFASTTSISGSTVNVATSANTINLNATTINIPNVAAGTDNTVVVYNGTTLVTDEIDPKVWAGNLVDKQGTPVQFQVATFNDADTLVGSANFTFNNSTLSVTGNVDASGPITGSNLMLDGTLADGAGETTVLVIDGSGNVKSDEIDVRVWGSTLIDGTLTANRIPYASDTNTVTDSGNLTFDGSKLTVTGEAAVSSNLTVGGDLIVNGDLTYINTANTLVEDQFILLGSGSAEGSDIGIIFDGVGGTTGAGAAFFFDGGVSRLSYATSVAYNATSVTPAAYIPLVFDVTGQSHTPVTDVGNIKIEDGEAYIYV